MSLISREKLLAHFSWWPDTDENKGIFESIIARQPDVDAEPVRHGKWDDASVAFYRKCTKCGCCVEWDKKPFLFGDGEYNYCPNCGARMDGGADDAVD